MRPTYENEESLSNEAEVAARLELLWNREMYKLPRSMHMDYSVTSDKNVNAFLEIKCRTNHINDYPQYFISLSKVIAAKNLFDATGLHTMLVVRSRDNSLHGIQLDTASFDLKIAGRTDRNDKDDIEPCCFFNVTDFKRYE